MYVVHEFVCHLYARYRFDVNIFNKNMSNAVCINLQIIYKNSKTVLNVKRMYAE